MQLTCQPEAAISQFLAPGRFRRLGVAVSGGGDSMALLHLLAGQAGAAGVGLSVVSVNHGLRAGAAAELALVAAACARLGLPHAVLDWRWDGAGNLPDAARRARIGLMAAWARGLGIGDVALGHSLDDQAETFVMRLARGAGVDGLAGMAALRHAAGVGWHRPLLGVTRQALRDWLVARGIAWAEDPTNDDPRYDRVRARAALRALAGLGIDAAGIAATQLRLAAARSALDAQARALAAGAVRLVAGSVQIAPGEFAAAPAETRARLLAAGLRWVASAEYRPRQAGLDRALAVLAVGGRMTLAGCVVSAGRVLCIGREPAAALAAAAVPAGALWDGRWRVTPPAQGFAADVVVRALGAAGLRECPPRGAQGPDRATLLASPAVWSGGALVAAPLAGRAAGWTAQVDGPLGPDLDLALSH